MLQSKRFVYYYLGNDKDRDKIIITSSLSNFGFKTHQGNQSLGIMIIEGKHAEVGQGIFVSDIQEGSNAEKVCIVTIKSTENHNRILIFSISLLSSSETRLV